MLRHPVRKYPSRSSLKSDHDPHVASSGQAITTFLSTPLKQTFFFAQPNRVPTYASGLFVVDQNRLCSVQYNIS